jgi:hypothetical protein
VRTIGRCENTGAEEEGEEEEKGTEAEMNCQVDDSKAERARFCAIRATWQTAEDDSE